MSTPEGADEDFDDVLSRITATGADTKRATSRSAAIPIPPAKTTASLKSTETDHVAASLQSLHKAVAEGTGVALANSIETKGIREEVLAQQLVLESIKTTGENNTKKIDKMHNEILTRVDKLDKAQKENLVKIATAVKETKEMVIEEAEATREHTNQKTEEVKRKIEEDGDRTRSEFTRNARGITRMVLTCGSVILGLCLLPVNALAGFIILAGGVGITQLLANKAIDQIYGWFLPPYPPPQPNNNVVDESGVEMTAVGRNTSPQANTVRRPAQAEPLASLAASISVVPPAMVEGVRRRTMMTN